MVQLPWSYKGSATSERLANLTSSVTYREIVTRLRQEMVPECFHQEPRWSDPSYSRAVFTATVGPRLFDLFFNSRTGYRGAYYDAPDKGLSANRQLFDELAPVLVEWAAVQHVDANRNSITSSLSLPSAKAWLAEEPLSLCGKCLGEWSNSYVSSLHIVNGRWDISKHAHASWGSQAQELTKIRFFGGFVNANNDEWIAAHKSNRASQLWKHGWL